MAACIPCLFKRYFLYQGFNTFLTHTRLSLYRSALWRHYALF